MGLTRQETGGSWLNNMLTFWPFVLIYTFVAVILGQIIIRHALHFQWKRDIPFMLNHLGLFVAMTAGTLGNADMQRLKMVTALGETEWRALTQRGVVKEMPLSIELKQFIMETYDDGSPKRFASKILIETKAGRRVEATVDVNKPCEVEGWKIYQYGYDTQARQRSVAAHRLHGHLYDAGWRCEYVCARRKEEACMTWEQFVYFAVASVLLWVVGAWAAWRHKTVLAYTTTVAGLVVFFSFILSMWISWWD